MAPSDQTPLPLAPDRAAISNRIALLLASQSSVLKSMRLASSPSTSTSAASTRTTATTKHTRQQQQQQQPTSYDDDDEDLFRLNTRPNEGVGYVPDALAASQRSQSRDTKNSKEDRMLRGRILGKRGADGGSKDKGRKGRDEDEEDDDPGRSSLGKRKRPRKTPVDVVAEEEPVVESVYENNNHDEDGEQGQPGDGEGQAAQDPAQNSTPDVLPAATDSLEPNEARKKRKKKNKNKKKKITSDKETSTTQ